MNDANTGKVCGKLIIAESTKTYGQKGFRKRKIVLAAEDNWTEIEVYFIRDDVDQVDELAIGDQLEIKVAINGRRYTKKDDPTEQPRHFVNLEAIEVKVLNAEKVKVENPADLPF